MNLMPDVMPHCSYYSQSNKIKNPVAIANLKLSVYMWFEVLFTY